MFKIRNSEVSNVYTGNTLVKNIYIEDKLIRHYRNFETLFNFGSGSNGIAIHPGFWPYSTDTFARSNDTVTIYSNTLSFFNAYFYGFLQTPLIIDELFTNSYGVVVELLRGSPLQTDTRLSIEIGDSTTGAYNIYEFFLTDVGYQKTVIPMEATYISAISAADYTGLMRDAFVTLTPNLSVKVHGIIKFLN